MSFAVQSSGYVQEEAFFAVEEQAQDTHETTQDLSSSKGALNTPGKQHTCEYKPAASQTKNNFIFDLKKEKNTKEDTESSTSKSESVFSCFSSQKKEQKPAPFFSANSNGNAKDAKADFSSNQKPAEMIKKEETPTLAPLKQAPAEKTRTRLDIPHRSTDARRASSSDTPKKEGSYLQNKLWTHKETPSWWNERYHKREGEKEKQHGGQGQQEDPKPKKKKEISAASRSTSCMQASFEGQVQQKSLNKPYLPPPKLGIFVLYFILTKIGIYSDATANYAHKKEIESVNHDTTETHQKRLKELKEAIEKERSASRWGIMIKVASWIGSLMGIISGIAMIATGVGAVAGAMLVAGGIIQITNQILEISGGWQKIAELLPGDDPEKKRAVINWMQIGIAVLCCILAGAGIIWGGFGNFGEGMQIASRMIPGIAMTAVGVGTIGEGITSFMYREKRSEVQKYDILLAKLKHRRHDLMETMSDGIDRLEKLFEDLANFLEFELELFRADQMINRY